MQTYLYSKLCSITSSFNLSQDVTEPTRTSDHSCTLIDLIFVSSPSQVQSCSIIPPLANSDHFGLHLSIYVMSPKKQTRMPPRQVWRYSHADYDALAVLLDDLDWDTI